MNGLEKLSRREFLQKTGVASGGLVFAMTLGLPRGADAVQMVEKSREEGERVVIYEPVTAGRHVAPRGEDLRSGAVALEAGEYGCDGGC